MVIKSYEELWAIRDKRVDDWPLMASPWPTVALSAAYVISAKVIGPALMKNR